MKATGYLVKAGHTYVFRQLSKDGTWVDHTLLHDKIAITIEDNTAEVVENNGESFIQNNNVEELLRRGW